MPSDNDGSKEEKLEDKLQGSCLVPLRVLHTLTEEANMVFHSRVCSVILESIRRSPTKVPAEYEKEEFEKLLAFVMSADPECSASAKQLEQYEREARALEAELKALRDAEKDDEDDDRAQKDDEDDDCTQKDDEDDDCAHKTRAPVKNSATVQRV